MNPQIENGFTRIANELYEATLKLPLSSYEFRVLHTIIRKTYGYSKTEDYIAQSQISKLTNIAQPHVSRTLKLLILYGIVTKRGIKLRLVKDYSAWKYTKLGIKLRLVKDYSAWKYTKLGNSEKAKNFIPKQDINIPKQDIAYTKIGIENIPKQAIQKKKETITKETYTKEKERLSHIGELTDNDFINVAELYKVTLAFVRSKYDDMVNWHEEDLRRNNKKNWLATLRVWVKKDAIKIRKEVTQNERFVFDTTKKSSGE